MSIPHWLKQRRLPRYCALCTQRYSGEDAICKPCQAFLAPIPWSCTYCALPLPEGEFLTCGDCILQKPYLDEAFAPYSFKEPLRTLLHEFKYRQGLYLVSFLSTLMIQHVQPHALQTECLIPVPMHPKRLRQRGFNHAGELVKCLAHRLQLPYHLDACKKIIHTLPQAGLNAHDRQKNLRNVFEISPMNFKRVTIVDDLITTGSTANELAKTLKQSGVEHVTLWCCARVSD